jgi:DNA-binding Lrp family transcriptional regulator
MSFFSTGHDVVDQVGSVHLEGNVLPTNWFNSFRLENGKPDVNAVILLSEIVYWHRPTVVRDEDTGQVIRIKKKFKADLLQRSYQSFSDQFGFSKQQVKEALDRLEKFGVIKRHFRTIEVNNQKYNNVLFIELITPVLFEVTTLSLSKWGGSTFSNGEAPHLKRGTNTETTTEITTDINTQQDSPENSNADMWNPNLETLGSILKTTKHSQRVSEILSMEDFQFHLGNFNTHHEKNHQISDNQKYRKFAQWIIQEFEKQLAKAERTAKQSSARTSEKPNNRNVNEAWKDIPEFQGDVEPVEIPEDFV